MTNEDREMAKDFAWAILERNGYNYALSDVEDACKYLDHPELRDDDPNGNFHKWVDPFPRRCYCGAIGYTESGRFYAIKPSGDYIRIMEKLFPDYKNRYGQPYEGKL